MKRRGLKHTHQRVPDVRSGTFHFILRSLCVRPKCWPFSALLSWRSVFGVFVTNNSQRCTLDTHHLGTGKRRGLRARGKRWRRCCSLDCSPVSPHRGSYPVHSLLFSAAMAARTSSGACSNRVVRRNRPPSVVTLGAALCMQLAGAVPPGTSLCRAWRGGLFKV